MKNRLVATLLLPALLLNFVPTAHADFAEEITQELSTTNSNEGKIVLTVDSIQALLEDKNTDLAMATNKVMFARDSFHDARAALLPSLNLNFILSFASPHFMINSVSCLVPFLFPATWMDFKAARRSKWAEEVSMSIAELNAYAAAYSLMNSVAGDLEIYQEMLKQYDRLNTYVSSLSLQVKKGFIPRAEELQGQVKVGKIETDLSKMRELVAKEKAAIRKLFAIPLEKDFVIVLPEAKESSLESQVATSAMADKIVAMSPEKQQLDLLIEAAKYKVKSQAWGFLAGCSGSSSNYGGSAVQKFNYSTGVFAGIGFQYFTKRKMAKRAVEDLYIREDELKLELTRQLEVTLSSISEAKIRGKIALQNSAMAENLLKQQSNSLDLGKVFIRDVLDAYDSATLAKIEAISSRSLINGHRITLKRLALEENFYTVAADADTGVVPAVKLD